MNIKESIILNKEKVAESFHNDALDNIEEGKIYKRRDD